MRPQKLEINSLANAVSANGLALEQHQRFADASWLQSSANTIQRICREQPDLAETMDFIQSFADYFILVETGMPDEVIVGIGAAIKSAINCGFFIATLEQQNGWKFKKDLPSPEAETLLSATSDALEREILRQWGDSHSSKLRTVALIFGYLLGRPDIPESARSLSGVYQDRWGFVARNS